MRNDVTAAPENYEPSTPLQTNELGTLPKICHAPANMRRTRNREKAGGNYRDFFLSLCCNTMSFHRAPQNYKKRCKLADKYVKKRPKIIKNGRNHETSSIFRVLGSRGTLGSDFDPTGTKNPLHFEVVLVTFRCFMGVCF